MTTNPLLDDVFLKTLYQQQNKEIYAKVIALTKDEDPVEEIQGRISSGGSINIDGTSTMRRTCSLTIVANDMNTNDYYWGLNNKFQLEIGLANALVGYCGFDPNLTYYTKTQDSYSFVELNANTYVPNTYYFYNGEQYILSRQYPEIIWFKEGIYVITSFSSSQSVSSYTISVQGKDKMSLLNGEVSGSLYAAIDFGKEEYEKKVYTQVALADSKNYIDKYYYTTKNEYAVANIDYIMYEPNLYYEFDGVEYKLCSDANFSSKKTYYYKIYNLATGEYNANETYYKLNSIVNIKSVPIKNIIKEAVHEYAQEPYEKIIVNDLDDYGLELLEYRGDENTPLYMIISENEDNDVHEVIQMTLRGDISCYLYNETTGQYTSAYLATIPKYNPRVTLDFNKAPAVDYSKIKLDLNTDTIYSVAKITYGETCGYRLTDITYAGNLISSIGETVTSILDKIVTMLGNFEYFYDVNGRFIFRKKQTYLDNSWNNIVTNEEDIYAESAMYTSADVWSFRDGLLISSFANSPSLSNVKNDYALWGTRTSVTGKELPVHLRYAIDAKPTFYKSYNGTTYTTQGVEGEDIHICDWRELIYQMALDYRQHNHDDDFLIKIRENNGVDGEGEWRYPTGYTGYEQYYVDMEGFWRQLYDGTNWVSSVTTSPETINFWFDFLDTDGDIKKFSIKTIGDRAKSVNDNTIKAIYFREVPTTILCENISTTERKPGYTYMQYIQGMDGLFNISSQGKSAKDVLDDYLYKYAYCIESISITAVPLYHLEPNTRIFIEDKNSGINGEYLISKITIPLSYNGTMSISATKAIDRIY